MDTDTENKISMFLYFSISIFLVFLVLYNIHDPWVLVFLSGLLIFSITVRQVIIYPNRRYFYLRKFSFLIDIMLIFSMGWFDASGSSGMYYFTVIADAATSFSYIYSSSITVLCIFSFLAERIIFDQNLLKAGFFLPTSLNVLAFVLFYGAMSIVKYEINQRQILNKTMYELKAKTKKLEDAYIKLRDTSEDIEEMAVLSERNKIAREIHDTVGHTLTTVLIEMEAGERLLSKNPGLAAEKIGFAKSQVRKGLGDIRESVGVLNSGREIIGLAPSLQLLINETAKHGDIFVNYEISELPKLTSQQEKAIYRALQEGLTNGIKHGGSTAFVFKLTCENGNICFLLEDNGKGCERIVPGFGLAAMEQRVREAGGVFNISSADGEGCRISISIPFFEEDTNDADQDSCGR